MKNDFVESQVFKHLSTPDAKGPSCTNFEQDVRDFTIPGVLEKRACTAHIIDFDVETSVKPPRPCGGPIKIEREHPHLYSHSRTAGRTDDQPQVDFDGKDYGAGGLIKKL